MFRKLVSNLAFSPALISEVGFYAKRLRKEEATRRLTVLFTVLALIVQSLAVFSPPESANASSEQDIIRGGVSSLESLLSLYDHNNEDIKDIYSAIGITRDEVANSKPALIPVTNGTYLLNRYGQMSNTENEVSISYPRSSGGMGIRYFSPLSNADHVRQFDGWVGQSGTLGWFGIAKNNGGIITRSIPASGSQTAHAPSAILKTISGFNMTQNAPITSTSEFQTLDKARYSIKVTNRGATSVTAPLAIRIADTLEYAVLIDGGGGSFDQTTSTLSWPQAQLDPGKSEERTFAVQFNSQFAATPRGKSDPLSFDCKITAVFGDKLETPVHCPAPKVVESIITQSPTVGTGLNITFASIIALTVGFFYLRTRQLKKEIQVIRHNFNAGII